MECALWVGSITVITVIVTSLTLRRRSTRTALRRRTRVILLALLDGKTASVAALRRRVGLPRTAFYAAAESLERDGLIVAERSDDRTTTEPTVFPLRRFRLTSRGRDAALRCQ
jgi:DNA-binding transcriptional ArsR family regulator